MGKSRQGPPDRPVVDRDGRVMTLNPTPGAMGTRIDAEKYEAVRRALLDVVPAEGEGVRFADLSRLVEERLPGGALPGGGSMGWYVTVVKLDLEARGLILRVPRSRPQRVLRRADAGASSE